MVTSQSKVVVSSGGFDPLHIGHLRMFEEAKKMGDWHVVILNNDNWLLAKKGFVFMPQSERKEIVKALLCVDDVVVTRHTKSAKDMSVVSELKKIQPHIFVNGGDRVKKNTPELEFCNNAGVKFVYVGYKGNRQSSSQLLKAYQSSLASSPEKRIPHP